MNFTRPIQQKRPTLNLNFELSNFSLVIHTKSTYFAFHSTPNLEKRL